MRKLYILLCFALSATVHLPAQKVQQNNANALLQFAPIFSNNMVLQRDKPIVFFGKAIPGQTVTVHFARYKKSTVAANDSIWKITFKPEKANNKETNVMVESGEDKIMLRNILIGDVWLCIGQSNMEWPLKKEAHYNTNKNYLHATIRFYNPSYIGKNIYGVRYNDSIVALLNTKEFYKGEWQQCNNYSVKEMSAVAYYFAETINQETQIPIGMINLSIGGAPLETFIRSNAFANHPLFKSKLQGNWLFNNSLPVWIRERGRQNISDRLDILQDNSGSYHAYKPGYAYEKGVALFTQMSIKGILCYQGESNAQELERVQEYASLQQLLVKDYRRLWNDSKLPYYFVQLSSKDTFNYKGKLWPLFRDEQRKSMHLIPYSGMAVSSDIGARNDVHPTNKKDVGERLAQWALHKTYKKNNIPSGPLPLTAKYKKGKVIITFKYTGQKLATADGADLKGFSIDAKTPASAIINHKTVEIASPQKATYIYYGWQPFTDANLVNSAKLPASTFKIKVE